MLATQLTTFAGSAILAACLGVVWSPSTMASGTTAVEKLIAASNPCAELKSTQFGLTVGIDQLQGVTVDGLDMSLRGDDFSLALAGKLACGTPDTSLVEGNASASVNASATLDLSDCRIVSLDIDLSDFGGTLAVVLENLQYMIENQLKSKMHSVISKECEHFIANF